MLLVNGVCGSDNDGIKFLPVKYSAPGLDIRGCEQKANEIRYSLHFSLEFSEKVEVFITRSEASLSVAMKGQLVTGLRSPGHENFVSED